MLFVDARMKIRNFKCLLLRLISTKHPRNRRFRMEKLLDIMEDDDDVQNVWHNWDED